MGLHRLETTASWSRSNYHTDWISVTFDELHARGHARLVEQSVYDTGCQRKCGIKADRNFPTPAPLPSRINHSGGQQMQAELIDR